MQCFCPCRCPLKGSCQQLTVGQPVTLTLHTVDAYSNPCWDSADKVHAGLCGPTGTALTAAAVEDLRNGAYGISFIPDVAGRWTVLPRYCVQQLQSLQQHAVLACPKQHADLAWHKQENLANLTMLHTTCCGCRCRYCHECACFHQSLRKHSMKLAECACYHSMQAYKHPCRILPCCLSPDHTEWLQSKSDGSKYQSYLTILLTHWHIWALLAFECGMTKVLCRLNGQLLHEKGFEMHASYGPVAAEDCVLKPLQPINKVIVNSSSCFGLSTADAGTTGRAFDGTEGVIAFVTGEWYVNICVQAAACQTW